MEGLKLAKGDHFWLPKSVQGTGFDRGTEMFVTGPVGRGRRTYQTMVLCEETSLRKFLPEYVGIVNMHMVPD